MTVEQENLAGLDRTGLGYHKYLTGLSAGPLDDWSAYYRTPNEGMNFGLRFQIAFAGYALYAQARRTPAYRRPYAEALGGLVERMLRPEVWAYWFRGAAGSIPLNASPAANPLQQAAGVAHSRLGLGGPVSPDPCREGNIQYSAHLASLLGFYELISGDRRYDEAGFVLAAEARGRRYEFSYTYGRLADNLHRQMRDSHFGGACCEPGRAYAACNNHACISNILHDRLRGTSYAAVNRRWAEWVERRLLTGGRRGGLPLPAPNGLLSMAYMPGLRMPVPISFNLTDAWGLAFMAAWEPGLVREIYPRLRRRLKKAAGGALYLGSAGPNESLEISTVGLNTAFAAVLAREMGDELTYERLLDWCEANLGLRDDPAAGRYFAAARPAPYVTALLALAHSLPAGGGGLRALLDWRPDFSLPYLDRIDGAVVAGAGWQDGGLLLELETEPDREVEMVVAGSERPASISVGQVRLEPAEIESGYSAPERRQTIRFRALDKEITVHIRWN